MRLGWKPLRGIEKESNHRDVSGPFLVVFFRGRIKSDPLGIWGSWHETSEMWGLRGAISEEGMAWCSGSCMNVKSLERERDWET